MRSNRAGGATHASPPPPHARVRGAQESLDAMTHPVLAALRLSGTESGTYLGNGEW